MMRRCAKVSGAAAIETKKEINCADLFSVRLFPMKFRRAVLFCQLHSDDDLHDLALHEVLLFLVSLLSLKYCFTFFLGSTLGEEDAWLTISSLMEGSSDASSLCSGSPGVMGTKFDGMLRGAGLDECFHDVLGRALVVVMVSNR